MGLSVCLSLCLLSMGHMTSGWLWKPKPAPAPSQKTSGWLWKPTPTPAISSSHLHGCYVDQWSRTLNGGMTKSSSMTVDKCLDICKKSNKKYYGLENGEECFCGDYLTKSYKKSDSECKMACKGKRAQACGGTWRVLIYRNPYYRSILVKSGYQGCYQDQSSRTLNGKLTRSSSMTVYKCRDICSKENTYYYGVENANECFCGNSLTRSVRKSDNDCLTQCRGDRSQGCGGSWRVAVYRNYNYKKSLVGCYIDQRDRVLTGGKTKSSSMTLSKCRSRCEREKKKFYGLEVGTECFCGNYLKTSSKRSTSECLTPCTGNKAEGCGGNWRVVIYRNNNYRTNLVKTDFVGCYRDQWSRTLNGKKTTDRHMTYNKCKNICSHKEINSKYFGLENRDECFCGNSLTRRVIHDSEECTETCKGNSIQGCGGPWRVAVYKNPSHKQTAVSSQDLFGCFIDQKNRVLNGGKSKSSTMTLQKCKKRCVRENKKFYGLEVGTECFCGNYLTKHNQRPNKECMTPCKGDRSQACGGGWRVLIHNNTKYTSNVVNKDFKGCYVDQKSRTLKDYSTSSSKMTVEKCKDTCHKKNYKYYGVEATKECFCGNKLTKTVKKDTEECSSPCKGNRAQGCGGNWRLAVYENTKFPNFVGCYKDQRSRTLTEKKISSKKMTVDMCRKECLTLKMKYYGLEARDECFCGNKLQKKVVVADGECTDTCKGNKNQACGGSWKLAVYENPSFRHSE
uniref:Putative fungistatic metabolite n=1 Tax=Magallana gigas TaxID=29159 RepID=K1QKY9_MAGGI